MASIRSRGSARNPTSALQRRVTPGERPARRASAAAAPTNLRAAPADRDRRKKNVERAPQISVFRKLKLANRARLDLFPPGVFVWCLMRTPPRACSGLLLGLFRLVVALVPSKRPLRPGLESKREFRAVGQELADLLYFTSGAGDATL
jgi:hypothetical protein